jgi:multicomponent Na+:H+ antiporter subunit E
MTAWLRFPLYVPWLLWQIFTANIWVLYLVFHPRMREMLNPRIITFKSRLKSRMAQLTFANSITLTPGTITVDVDWDGTFTVHALDEKSAAGLPGEMERHVARVFGEE